MDHPVVPLLENRFLKVFDLQYAPGRHYYVATRRAAANMVAAQDEASWADLLPDAVSVCLILHEQNRPDRMVLNREYRYPLGHTVISVPAGLIDAGDRCGSREQALLTAASREIYEETGLTLTESDRVRVLNPCLFSSPGMTDESNAMVRVDLFGHAEEELTQAHAESTERFEGFSLVTREEARDLLFRGNISVYTWIGLSAFIWMV